MGNRIEADRVGPLFDRQRRPGSGPVRVMSHGLAACLAALCVLLAPAAVRSQTVPAKEYGVWFWSSASATPWATSRSLIDQAQAAGFNAIYLTVGDYLKIAAMAPGPARATAARAYAAAVDQFVSYANQKGMAVDALSGAANWAEPGYIQYPFEIYEWAAAYNSHHAARLRHVQYDIEPYKLAAYNTNWVNVMWRYIDLVNQLVANDTADIGIEMTIPFFYDRTKTLTYNGRTGTPFSLLLLALDKRPGDAMVMLDYRNYAQGTGGSIDLSARQMAQASQSRHITKIIIAQECSNVSPAYITFYDTGKDYLASQLSLIDSAYAGSAAFGGIAIEYINTYLQLR